MNKNDLVAVRDFQPNDKNFILATWLRGLKYGNDWFNAIDPGIYFVVYQAAIERLLGNPNISVKVACLKEDPEVVLGYAVYSGARLDWVFVKKAWRGVGIAKGLVPTGITCVSHLTTVGRSILKKREGIIFNPFSIN